jgi:hypothetical protein
MVTKTERDASVEIMILARKALAAIKAQDPSRIIMSQWTRWQECGTAHCIGGWMEYCIEDRSQDHLFKLTMRTDNELHKALNDMFYLRGAGIYDPCNSMTAFDLLPADTRKAAAIKVLENFLEFREPRWGEVLKGMNINLDTYLP